MEQDQQVHVHTEQPLRGQVSRTHCVSVITLSKYCLSSFAAAFKSHIRYRYYLVIFFFFNVFQQLFFSLMTGLLVHMNLCKSSTWTSPCPLTSVCILKPITLPENKPSSNTTSGIFPEQHLKAAAAVSAELSDGRRETFSPAVHHEESGVSALRGFGQC